MLAKLLSVLFVFLVAAGPGWAAVDANTASREQLDAVRGIGPSIAERILAERAKRPFRDLDELQQRVRGVGPATLKKMQADGLVVASPAANVAGAASKASAAAGGAARSAGAGSGMGAGMAAGAGAGSPKAVAGGVGKGVVTELGTR